MNHSKKHEAGPQKYKKKRKRGLIQQMKKFGKKGQFGRGYDLPEDTFQYLVRVLELSNKGFSTPEDKELFVNNSFDQMVGEEINYSCNQLGCRVFEALLPFVNDEIMFKFHASFGEDLRPLVSDRFASHVLQKLIVVAADRGTKSDRNKDDPKKGLAYEQWVLKCGNFVMNNLEDFVWDTYGNHIIRTCLECLSGLAAGNTLSTAKKSNKETESAPAKEVPDTFKECVVEITRRLMLWPQFTDLPGSDVTSGLLQTLLFAIKEVCKKSKHNLVMKLIKECFKPNKDEEPTLLLPIFSDPNESRVLDAAIVVSTPKEFTKIYQCCFVNKLAKLATMHLANHQVQKLLQHCSDKREFEAIYEELIPALEEILKHKNTGVISSLAAACKRLSTKQQFFKQELMKVLHCYEPDTLRLHFAPLVAKLVPYEQQEGAKTNFHGSMTLQTLLLFNKPIQIVMSLLKMKTEELVALFKDPVGSFVLDTFMTSESIGEKSREKMIRKLQGSLIHLSCSKHGSRGLDTMWSVMSVQQKTQVMEELAPRMDILNANKFGAILTIKYKIELYKHRREDWVDLQGVTNKKRKLFEEIIGNIEEKKKK